MKADEVSADFQFLGNRVISLSLDTRLLETKGQRVEVSFIFDYEVKALEEREENYLGIMEFIVKVKATVGKKHFFKVRLVMEGAFACGTKSMPRDKFEEMLEINGLFTLSQISRAYLISVTSQSGMNPVKMPMINVMKLREVKKHSDDTKEKSSE